jgi:hypothetical protein
MNESSNFSCVSAYLHISRHFENLENAMTLKSFATVALILIPSFAFAAGGGGTGISNAGNGSPSGANSDASDGNTPVPPEGGNVENSRNHSSGTSGNSGSMGASHEMKRQNGESQKNP